VGAQREQQLGGGAGGAPASSGERDRRGRGEELQGAEGKRVWGLLGVGAGSSGGSALRGERRPWRRDERRGGDGQRRGSGACGAWSVAATREATARRGRRQEQERQQQRQQRGRVKE